MLCLQAIFQSLLMSLMVGAQISVTSLHPPFLSKLQCNLAGEGLNRGITLFCQAPFPRLSPDDNNKRDS